MNQLVCALCGEFSVTWDSEEIGPGREEARSLLMLHMAGGGDPSEDWFPHEISGCEADWSACKLF